MKKWLLLLSVIFLTGTVQAQEYSYLPTAELRDGKMFELISTGATGDIGTETLEFRFEISHSWSELRLGIFDGDISINASGYAGTGHWDGRSATVIPPRTIYSVFADPNSDGSGLQLKGVWDSDMMPDDAWFDCVVPLSPDARTENGNYVYRLQITSTNPHFPQFYANRFKIRVNGKLEIYPNTFEFVGALNGLPDLPYIYPNTILTPPYGPFEPTTYDGIFHWYFYLPRPVTHIEFWDGEFDYGQASLSLPHDTDDPNTPNDVLPPWGYLGDETLPEGVNFGAPVDDSSSPIYRRTPHVYYELIAPDGQVFRNDNPSGNREWERFRVDTAPFDPAVMDYHTDSLPAGIYQVIVYGVDLGNSKNFRFFTNIAGVGSSGEVIINVPIPPEHFCSVGDFVWEDLNRDGIQDPGEPGLPGVVLRLINDLGYPVDNVVSDENGFFLFNTIPSGAYTIAIDAASLPSGMATTTQNLPFPIHLAHGDRFRDADFGFASGIGTGCQTVFAWYQPWYGSYANGRSPYRHWLASNLGAAPDSASFTVYGNYPEVDPLLRPSRYDSYDADICEYHILSAWAAHIDAFVVDWHGIAAYEQFATRGLMDAAWQLHETFAAEGFDFRILIAYNEESEGGLDANLEFIGDSLFTHPAYYNHQEGLRPILFVNSRTGKLNPADFRAAVARNISVPVYIVWNWDPFNAALKGYVDSVYPWPLPERSNWDDLYGLKNGDEYLAEFYARAPELGLSFVTGGVYPGYDDRAFVNGQDHWIERLDGRTYTFTWDQAFKNRPRYVLLHSWNDFNRGTQLEQSILHRDLYTRLTQREAMRWKGGLSCGNQWTARDLKVPERVFNQRKAGTEPGSIAALIAAMVRAGQPLPLPAPVPPPATVPANALVFVSGSPAYPGEEWSNAVDGDLDGWDGTVTTKPRGDDPGGTAWALFRFGDHGLYQFDYITLQTDNGVSDDAVCERQAQRIEVLVSTTGQQAEDFASVTAIKVRSGGQMEWYALGRVVQARYVKLLIHDPKYTSGGWRQIVEFGVNTRERQGAAPAGLETSVAGLIDEYRLEQNHPNPFNAETVICYQIPAPCRVTLRVYDLQGREVASLVDGLQTPGLYRAVWRTENLASGVYFYRFQAGSFVDSKRLVLLR